MNEDRSWVVDKLENHSCCVFELDGGGFYSPRYTKTHTLLDAATFQRVPPKLAPILRDVKGNFLGRAKGNYVRVRVTIVKEEYPGCIIKPETEKE